MGLGVLLLPEDGYGLWPKHVRVLYIQEFVRCVGDERVCIFNLFLILTGNCCVAYKFLVC